MSTSPEKPNVPSVVRASPEELEALRVACMTHFTRFAEAVPNYLVLTVSTSDGRMLAMQAQSSVKADRIGALVGSLLAVAETSCRELGAGRCLQTIVCAQNQQLLVLRIGNTRSPFVLAGAYDNEIMLGSVLRQQNDLGEMLAQSLGKLFPFILEASSP